jgi:hypothetical protein
MKIQLNHHEAVALCLCCGICEVVLEKIRNISYPFFHYFSLLITRFTMKEDFLHYLWKFKKFDTLNLRTSNNEEVTVANVGSI